MGSSHSDENTVHEKMSSENFIFDEKFVDQVLSLSNERLVFALYIQMIKKIDTNGIKYLLNKVKGIDHVMNKIITISVNEHKTSEMKDILSLITTIYAVTDIKDIIDIFVLYRGYASPNFSSRDAMTFIISKLLTEEI